MHSSMLCWPMLQVCGAGGAKPTAPRVLWPRLGASGGRASTQAVGGARCLPPAFGVYSLLNRTVCLPFTKMHGTELQGSAGPWPFVCALCMLGPAALGGSLPRWPPHRRARWGQLRRANTMGQLRCAGLAAALTTLLQPVLLCNAKAMLRCAALRAQGGRGQRRVEAQRPRAAGRSGVAARHLH